MQIRKTILKTLLATFAGAVLLHSQAAAQSSSLNTFSPYTFYGLGDISSQGTTYMRSMGGAGIAYRNPSKINYLNPASMGGGMRNSFMINLGLEGGNYYLKDGQGRKTSFNTFNIKNIALQFPVSRIISVGVSVAPMSSVGYRIEKLEDDPDIRADLGRVTYNYEGEGGLTQVKAGGGIMLHRKLSVGAEMVYYQGRIERSFDINITPIMSTGTQSNIYSYFRNEVSKVYANFGVQYSPIFSEKKMLTVGATYQPGGKLEPRVTRMVPSGDFYADTVSYNSYLSDFSMPDMIAGGVFYQTEKLSVGADYSYQDWARNNTENNLTSNGVSYRNTSSFRLGGEYTPNRLDVRRFMNRMTYRFGFRYNDYYMSFNGQDVTDKAVTFGVGVPLKLAGLSSINVGLEAGTRGSVKNGMVKENYFKVSIGLSLFGEDDWFVKRRYY